MTETDYLIVGAGASALAFADALIDHADVEVILVDRRGGVGGHWRDAYPFVRLHTPSAYYGVGSLPLGDDRLDGQGDNAGFYERATGPEVLAYFEAVTRRLTATGRVRVLTGHEHLGRDDDAEVIRDLRDGTLHRVAVRRRTVDARYQEASIPATHRPAFAVGPAARVVSVNDLPEEARPGTSYVVLGAGKTAADACMWLLGAGVDPERIQWVRPRDAWFYDRAHFQPLDQVGSIMLGLALDAEAAASAADRNELIDRLEDTGRLVRLDPSVPAAMYRGTMLSTYELESLRQIANVIRLGHVRRIDADRIVLARGEVPTGPDAVCIDCTARGLRDSPAKPIFQSRRIVLQQIRHLSPTFNAALIGFVEARGGEDRDKNWTCPPNPYPSDIADWPGMVTRTWTAAGRWAGDSELSEWVTGNRLNLLAALPDQAAEPAVQDAVRRYATHVGPAIERLTELAQSEVSNREEKR